MWLRWAVLISVVEELFSRQSELLGFLRIAVNWNQLKGTRDLWLLVGGRFLMFAVSISFPALLILVYRHRTQITVSAGVGKIALGLACGLMMAEITFAWLFDILQDPLRFLSSAALILLLFAFYKQVDAPPMPPNSSPALRAALIASVAYAFLACFRFVGMAYVLAGAPTPNRSRMVVTIGVLRVLLTEFCYFAAAFIIYWSERTMAIAPVPPENASSEA